jgi:tetratricopeptide (TPR) repeat protein
LLPAIETNDQLDLATTYCNLGLCFENTSEFHKAIENYIKSLAICLKLDDFDTFQVSSLYFNIGKCYQADLQFKNAIRYYEKGYRLEKTGGYAFKIAECYVFLGDKRRPCNWTRT